MKNLGLTDSQRRQFYELCQSYRHTLITEQVTASERFNTLCDFVEHRISDRHRNTTFAIHGIVEIAIKFISDPELRNNQAEAVVVLGNLHRIISGEVYE